MEGKVARDSRSGAVLDLGMTLKELGSQLVNDVTFGVKKQRFFFFFLFGIPNFFINCVRWRR